MFPELNPDKFTRPQGMNITHCDLGAAATTSRASCCGAWACRSSAEEPKQAKAGEPSGLSARSATPSISDQQPVRRQ